MNSPYGLEAIDNCTTCKFRQATSFCNFSAPVLQEFSTIGHLSTYPAGATLFAEGQMPRGGFLLCAGRAKLFTTSPEGRILIFRIAEAGEFLGFSALVLNSPYPASAETVGRCNVNFIDRRDFVRLIRSQNEAAMNAAGCLGHEYRHVYQDIQNIVMAESSEGKLARLMISWCSKEVSGANTYVRIRCPLTHEEIAQMIGSSRETVTRLLGTFRKRQLITWDGATLVIPNRLALEALE
jgi:CRP/FNR family transcriptional regulator, cyclic AMP receptor protein